MQAPWPACGDDCLKAADFLLNGDIPELAGVKREKIGVIGGSAGGHLALYTGLKLPPEKVRNIIAISPIGDPLPDYRVHPERYDCLFGCETTEKLLQKIAPLQFVNDSSPEIFISHAFTDTAVPQESSINFINSARKQGAGITHFFYDGVGDGHRIWIPGSDPHRLLPEIEEAILKFLNIR